MVIMVIQPSGQGGYSTERSFCRGGNEHQLWSWGISLFCFSYVYVCFVLFRCVVIWIVLSPVLRVLFMILYMMIFVGHVFYFLQKVFLLPCVISNLLVVFLSFSLVSFLISLFVTSSLSDMVVSWKCTLTRCKVRRCSQLLQMWGSELLSRSLRILQTKAWFNKKPEKESSTFCVNVCSHINIHGLSYSTVYCTLYTMHNCLKRSARGGRFSEECQGDDQNSYCLIAGGATVTKFCQWVKPPKNGSKSSPGQTGTVVGVLHHLESMTGAEWRPGEAEVLCGGSSKGLDLMRMISELQWKLWEDATSVMVMMVVLKLFFGG